MSRTTATTDHDALKVRQRSIWSAGDYAVIGTTLQITGELLCEAVDVEAGERVLDVAAGNGNASLAAARRGCDVTASDSVPSLLDGTRRRAEAEGLVIAVREADAEALPFADGAFDAVLSTFGVMFTPDQERAAAELVRTCRPGGRIGLVNWTPDGFIGQMFRVIGRYAPPPSGVRSPLEWGTEARLAELFGGGAQTLDARRREFVFRYRSPEHWLDTFRSYYGPTLQVFAGLDPVDRLALEHELLALARENDTARASALRIPSAYLQVVVTVPS